MTVVLPLKSPKRGLEEALSIPNWLNDLFGLKEDKVLEAITELEEPGEMFATSLKKYGDQLKRESEEIGFQKGIQRGMSEGIEKGKIEDARKMKEKGMSLSDIIEITGLSLEMLAQAGIKE